MTMGVWVHTSLSASVPFGLWEDEMFARLEGMSKQDRMSRRPLCCGVLYVSVVRLAEMAIERERERERVCAGAPYDMHRA